MFLAFSCNTSPCFSLSRVFNLEPKKAEAHFSLVSNLFKVSAVYLGEFSL